MDKKKRAADRFMGVEVENFLIKSTEMLCEVHEAISRKQNGDHSVYGAFEAIFDAIRLHMVCAAAYLSQNGGSPSDEDLRIELHGILDLAIADYQFNERRHVGARSGS